MIYWEIYQSSYNEDEFSKKEMAKRLLKAATPSNRTTARGVYKAKKLCLFFAAEQAYTFGMTLPENANTSE
jgi:hypothetical protein